MKLTKQEKALITLFTNYLIEVAVSGNLLVSDNDDLEIQVTEDFVKKLREIL